MDQIDISSSDREYIEINGIDTFIRFARYNPDHPDMLLDGLELSEDLTNKFGTKLYPRGAAISQERVTRLLQLRDNNPNLDLSFKIKRSASLIQTFRENVKEQIIALYKRRLESLEFKELFSKISENFESFIDEILTEESITLALYKFGFMHDNSQRNEPDRFLEHPLNVALASLAIASSEIYSALVKNDRTLMIDVCKAGLFHNYGALSQIDEILKYSPDKRFGIYWNTNLDEISSLEKLGLDEAVIQSFRSVCEYYTMGKSYFISRDDRSSIIANIVLVADAFLQKESGLFAEPQPVKRVMDRLNVRVAEKRLNETAVRALTIGMNLVDLFDYYKELEKLAGECPQYSGVPYPLTGMKSATLFICKKSIARCKYLNVTRKAVNLVKQTGQLKPGKYYRCMLLTYKLQAFYKEHYKDIKQTVVSSNKDTE